MEEGTETNRYFGCFDIMPGHAYGKRAWASNERFIEAAGACRRYAEYGAVAAMHLLSELTRQDQ